MAYRTGWSRRVALSAGVSTLFLGACTRRVAASAPQLAVPAPTGAAIQLCAAATAFGGALLGRVKRDAPTSSVLISPLSLMAALTMLGQGARGATADNLAAGLALRSHGLTLEAAGEAFANVRARLVSSPSATVAAADGLWVDPRANLNPSFARVESQRFGARITSLDLSGSDAPGLINHFVDQATHGKIPSIVDQLSPDDLLVLVSALYFKGGWDKTFNPADTRPAPFTRADGGVATAPMMWRQDDTFAYLETGAFQAVSLPYADPRFELTLVLAKPGAPQTEGTSVLSSDFAARPGQVFVPRLDLQWGLDVQGALGGVGLGTALGPSADYGVATAKPVSVGQVMHRTMLTVDEQGAEAAAATAEEVATADADVAAPTPRPFVFRADRPFHLVIRDSQSRAPLFMAYVASPSDAPPTG